MKKIRLCIIGTGAFANITHGPSLKLLQSRDPDLELTAAADIDSTRAEAFARTFGFQRSYGNWQEMLQKEHPDCVSILTHVSATSEVGSRVLSAGYPVMLEKPPGRNRTEINALIQAQRKSGAPVMVAFNRRYIPLLAQLQQIREHECKEPVEHIRCDFYRCGRMDEDFSTTAIHGIDTARHLAGTRYLRADIIAQPLKREHPINNTFIQCEFEGGISGVLSFCPFTGASFERYTVCTPHWTLIAETVLGGTDVPGRIWIYHDGLLLRMEMPTPHIWSGETLFLGGFVTENAVFIDRVRNGFPAFDDLATSLDAVEIADAVRHGKRTWTKQE